MLWVLGELLVQTMIHSQISLLTERVGLVGSRLVDASVSTVDHQLVLMSVWTLVRALAGLTVSLIRL